jgi:hypothetical protein
MAEIPTITWTINLEQANLVLQVLGKGKFDRVADVVLGLRQQAQQQVQKMQQEAQQQQQAQEGDVLPPHQSLANGHDKSARPAA